MTGGPGDEYLWWVSNKVVVHVVVHDLRVTDSLERLFKGLVLVCASNTSLAGSFE